MYNREQFYKNLIFFILKNKEVFYDKEFARNIRDKKLV